MAAGVKIICFGDEEWSPIGKRSQHLMSALAACPEVASVLFVNPPVSVSVKDILQRRLDGARLGRQAGAYWAALRGLPCRVADKVVTVTASDKILPLSRWPRLRRSGALRRLNRLLYGAALRRQLHRLPGTRLIVWVSHAMFHAAPALFPARALLVYDWMDDWEQFAILPVEDVQTLRAWNDELLRRADVVLTVSRALEARARAVHPRVHLVPNATHADHFARAAVLGPTPDLAAVPPPRLGYLGRIGDRVDYDLLAYLADSRPGWSLALVGPVWPNAAAAMDRLCSRPNVHWLGPQPYDRLPAYIAGFDACLIPHTRDALTASMDPIKLYDYLASGRPVVSTRVAGVDRFADAIYIADTPPAFVRAVEAALGERSDSLRDRRRAYGRIHSWPARAQAVWNALDAALAGGPARQRVQLAT